MWAWGYNFQYKTAQAGVHFPELRRMFVVECTLAGVNGLSTYTTHTLLNHCLSCPLAFHNY